MTLSGSLSQMILEMIKTIRDNCKGSKIHSNGGINNPNVNLRSPSRVVFDIESFETDAVNAAWFLVEMSRQEFWKEKDRGNLGTVQIEPGCCVRDARVSDADRPLAASKIPMNDVVLPPETIATDATRDEDELTLGHNQENKTAPPPFRKGASKRSSRARGQSFKGKLRSYRTKRVKARKNQRDSTVQETESSGTPEPELDDSDDDYDISDVPVKSRNFRSLSALLGTK